jgi:hypothetical protein
MPTTPLAERRVTDGVDPAMHLMKKAASDPALDATNADADLEELLQTDDPFLVGGDPRDQMVHTVRMRSPKGVNMTRFGDFVVGLPIHRMSIRMRSARVARQVRRRASKRGSNPPVPPLALIP